MHAAETASASTTAAAAAAAAAITTTAADAAADAADRHIPFLNALRKPQGTFIYYLYISSINFSALEDETAPARAAANFAAAAGPFAVIRFPSRSVFAAG